MSVSKAGRPWRAATGIALISAVIAACGAPSQVEVVISSARSAASSAGQSDGLQTQSATVGGTGAGPEQPAGEPDPRGDDLADQHPDDSGTPPAPTSAAASARPGVFTIAFAGDVNFAERTADRLAADPATAFGVAAPGLAAADLTMVNLETAIATGGDPEPKSFTFRAPPAALTALADAGIDVASMANNHGADFGATGLAETVAAIDRSGFPVIGIGANSAQAMAPFRTTINGVGVAIFAVTAVHDHTLESWTAAADGPGVASAFDPQLLANVTAAAAKGETAIVFLHWGTEYESCPDGDQLRLADALAAAGAAAVIGTHAHVLQGAGWRGDGTYVAYGLSNFLWWRSFGNEQDDNGVLTLTFDGKRVTNAMFAPSHLDDTGVPVPATGAEADRINAEWQRDRECTDLAGRPPG
jgi:poly-gamma-glutamate synthesis protein (capsule biosynthesis protein)